MTAEVAERTHTGVLSEMNETGDAKIKWDRGNPDEVAAARAAFDKLKKAGHLAYRKTGGDREQLREFDPDAEHIVMVAQPVGG